LAANWPWAVQLLLDSGADVSAVDAMDTLPLSYACFFRCHEAIKMLLSAESPLSSARRFYTVLDDGSINRDVPSFELLATALAQRRIRILDIARSVLPVHALNNILQSKKGIFDTESLEIIHALQKSGVRVDAHYLCSTDRSVYHTEDLLPGTAEILYNLGFSNVEGRDKRGLTPLASAIGGRDSNMKLVPWLVSKGADVHHWLESYHYLQVLHLVAAGIGKNLYRLFLASFEMKWNLFERFSDHGVDAIRVVLDSDSTNCYDHCSCPCSTKGCTASTMILKHSVLYVRSQKGYDSSSYIYRKWDKFRMTIVDWILAMEGPDSPMKRRIGLEALRLLLFDEMRLTHTCCRPAFGDIKPPMDYKDALELIDEQAEIIRQFQTLYDQAELEWERSSELFSRFLRKFINKNISRHNSEQTVDNEYLQAIRDIGVQLQETSDDVEDGNASVSSDESDDTEFTVSGEKFNKGSGPTVTLCNGTSVSRVVEVEEVEDMQGLEQDMISGVDDLALAREGAEAQRRRLEEVNDEDESDDEDDVFEDAPAVANGVSSERTCE
jgi:hypothetical protein